MTVKLSPTLIKEARSACKMVRDFWTSTPIDNLEQLVSEFLESLVDLVAKNSVCSRARATAEWLREHGYEKGGGK